jgi:hypothetical protein
MQQGASMVKNVKAALTAAVVLGSVGIAHAQVGGTAYTYNGSYSGTSYGEEVPSVIKSNELSISGAVGMPLNPTAQIPDKGQWRVQGSYYDLGSLDTPVSNYSQKTYGVYAAGRLGNLPVEVNVGVSKFNTSANGYSTDDPSDPLGISGTGFSVGAKYQVWRSEDGSGMASMGIGYDKNLYDNLYAYIVASKAFTNRHIVGHIGLRYDHYKINGVSSSQPSVYAGAEVPLDKDGRFAIVGELQSKNAADTGADSFGGQMPYSLSLRMASENGFSASVGVQRQGALSQFLDDSSGLFFQLGKSF